MKNERPLGGLEVTAVCAGVASAALGAGVIALWAMRFVGGQGPDRQLAFAFYAGLCGVASLVCFAAFVFLSMVARLRYKLFSPVAAVWILMAMFLLVGAPSFEGASGDRSRITVTMSKAPSSLVFFAKDSGFEEAVRRREFSPNAPFVFVIGDAEFTCLQRGINDGLMSDERDDGEAVEIEISMKHGTVGMRRSRRVLDEILACVTGRAKQGVEEMKAGIDTEERARKK